MYHVNISEASPVGSHLVKVNSNDADGEGQNRFVVFLNFILYLIFFQMSNCKFVSQHQIDTFYLYSKIFLGVGKTNFGIISGHLYITEGWMGGSNKPQNTLT